MNGLKYMDKVSNLSVARLTTLILIIASSFFLYSGCAMSRPSLQEQVVQINHKELVRTTSKDDFLAIEPTLLNLKQGTPIQSSGLTWQMHPINDQSGQRIGISAVSKGWLGPLSGGLFGAGYKLGMLSGRQGNIVYGAHFYGYTWMNNNLIPRYIVNTIADEASENEFEDLKNRKDTTAGWSWLPGGNNSKIFFKNVRIGKIQRTNFQEPSSGSISIGEPITSKSYVASHLSATAFHDVENKIIQLTPGTDVVETIQILGGEIVLFPPHDTLIIYGIKGYLNYRGQYRFEQITNDGFFSVWPFGFVAGEEETPKLALIFKNGEVFKVVPYTSQKELTTLFH